MLVRQLWTLRVFALLSTACAVFLFSTYTTHSAINEQIPFYGTLKDSADNRLTGTYDMVFRLYDAPTGGTLLDTSTHTVANGNAVSVSDGEFNVLLGSGTGNALDGVDFNTASIYVGLTIESDSEMSPRERLGSAAYAFNADTVDGYDADQLLRYNATGSMTVSSADTLLTITQNGAGDILNIYDGGTEVFTVLNGGNIGVGTSTPGYTFTIDGDLMVSSALYDNAYSAGLNGYVLQSNGSGLNWVATSTLGLGGGGGSPFTTSAGSNYLTDASSNLVVGTTTPQATTTGLYINNKDVYVAQGELSLLSTYQSGTFVQADDIAISGDYAYVADSNRDALVIFDISDPANPAEVGSVSDGTNLNGTFNLAVMGTYAYMTANFDDSFRVIDISDPTAPTIVGGVKSALLDGAWALALSGQYAFVAAASDDSVRTIDISDPANPFIAGGLKLGVNGTLDGAYDMALTGNYLYVLVDAGADDAIRVIDVSNPLAPTHVGSAVATGYSNLEAVVVSGNYLYTTWGAFGNGSLLIYDISDRINPTLVGTLNDSVRLNGADSLTISGDYVYVPTTWGDSVQVIDVSNPTAPVFVGQFSDNTLLDGIISSEVSGNNLFVGSYSGLGIFNLSGITSPTAEIGTLLSDHINTDTLLVEDLLTIRGSLQIAQNTYIQGTLGVYGGITLASTTPATSTNALYNVAGSLYFNGSALGGGATTFTALTDTPGSLTANSLLFASSTGTSLTQSPLLVFSGSNFGVGTSTPNYTMTVDGDLMVSGALYDNAYSAGLNGYVLQSNGSGLNWVATSSLGIAGGGSSPFTTAGSVTYLTSTTSSLAIGTTTTNAKFEVHNGLSKFSLGTPQKVGGLDIGGHVYDVDIVGNLAYIVNTSGNPGVDPEFQILDIADPTNPVIIGGSSASGTGQHLKVVGDYAYVAYDGSIEDEFYIYNVSDPTNPVVAGSVDISVGASGVFVAGRYAYVTTYAYGADDALQIFDITDPTNPVLVGGYDDPGSNSFENVVVSGRYAYVGSGSTGDEVEIIDVSDPTNPIKVGGAEIGAIVFDLALDGSYLYVTAGSNGGNELHVLDVSDPANPVVVGGYELNASGLGVSVAGDYIFVTTNNGSSESAIILDISSSTNPTLVTQVTGGSSIAYKMLPYGNYAYLVTNSGGDDFEVFDIGGILSPSANIGTLLSNTIDVGTQRVRNLLSVESNLLVGQNAFVQGSLAIGGNSSSSLVATTPALTVQGLVGIGTSTPDRLLSVAGDMRLTGALYDSTNVPGTSGYVLQTTGSGVAWVATSTLGLGGGGGSLFTDGGATTYLTSLTDKLAIGTTTGSSTLTIMSTAPQLHLGYDASNYATFLTNALGELTIAPSAGTTTVNSSLMFGGASGSNENILVGLNNGAPASLYVPTAGGVNTKMLYLDPDNSAVAFGINALQNATVWSDYAIAIGENAHREVFDGDYNIAIGFNSMNTATDTDDSIAIGRNTMEGAFSYQGIAMGVEAMKDATGDNSVAIGFRALYQSDSSSGLGDIAIGTNALNGGVDLYENIAIGVDAGRNLDDGSQNVLIGSDVLSVGCANSCYNNVALGSSALENAKQAFYAVAVGPFAMQYISTTTDTYGTVAVGRYAAKAPFAATNVAIGDVTSIGAMSLYNIGNGADDNTALGAAAGYNVSTGTNNILIGSNAGFALTTGSNNIVIGYDIDAPINTGNGQMTIGNLIFATGLGAINKTVSTGNIGIGTTTPSQKLTVSGTIQATNLLGGAVNLTTDASGNIIRDPSDARLKENVAPVTDALQKVLKLKGVSYEWKDKSRFGNQVEIGFIAQDVDLILPEVVRKGGEYWSINTRNILAVVVEGIKEIWAVVSQNKTRITELERKVQILEKALNIEQTASPAHTNSTNNGTDNASTTPTDTGDADNEIPDDLSDQTDNPEQDIASSTDQSVLPPEEIVSEPEPDPDTVDPVVETPDVETGTDDVPIS